MTSGEEFKRAYKALNSAQKEAVDTIEGPVMVIAGPGTGKTEILALRIANVLDKTDSRPENILALTFTDAGAHNMRKRLERYIGSDAYHVAVYTFHGLAKQLIDKYPDSYPRLIGARPATDIERFSVVEEIISSGDFKLLRPHGDPLYYVREIPHALGELKKAYLTPDLFAERISKEEESLALEPRTHEKGAHKGKPRQAYLDLEKRIEKHRELLSVYRQYQALFQSRRLFDFEDMILETVEALKSNEDMLRDLQETYHYLLADEHQDVNESQNKILELLADYHDRPNIFVVGDEKQAIFRFQGASLDNFLYFQDRFPGTKVISLTENYRSTQTILDAAFGLIKTDNEELAALRQPLESKAKGGRVELREFPHEAVEDDWVVEEVKKTLASGQLAEGIAIIVRNNKDVIALANTLRSSGIRALPSADNDVLYHPVTLAIENLIGSVVNLKDEGALFECLMGPGWGIKSGDLVRVLAERGAEWPLHRLIADPDKLSELSIEAPEKILNVAKVLEEARNKLSITPPHHIIQILVEKSGLLEYLMKEDPIEGAGVLRRVYDDVEGMVVSQQAMSLLRVAEIFNYRRQHNLPLNAPFINVKSGAVAVMTAHRSKGLEFETVIIPRATDKCFGGGRRRDLFKLPLLSHDPLPELGEEDDERRLFFVGLTRAKKNLLISWSENNNEGRLMEASRFISDIPEDKLDLVSTEDLNNEFKPAKIFTAIPSPLKIQPSLIRELFLARGFSVTHLNNYLEDPLKYLYENLLRKPHPRSLSLLFGEAMHGVLERSIEHYQAKKELPKDTLIGNWLRNELERLPLSQSDIASLHERGYAALITYIRGLAGADLSRSRNELSVKVTLTTNDSDLPEIPLTGKLDRVDYDEGGEVVRVVDYKTGKPKSLKEIQGETKNSDGRYKRQLVFYALLLSLYNPDQPLPKSFVLSFVEPKEKTGEVVEFPFTITKEEVETLKQEVIKVAKEIVSGEKFLLS